MKLRPLLRLARVPNVFTAFANVVAGVALTRGGSFRPADLSLVAASGALYSAGMVWNDYFDREVDARERPQRPIPAKQVSVATAVGLGTVLTVLGIILSGTKGKVPLVVALGLTSCIFLYDGWLKQTALGPLAMGACRGLNLTLGLSVLPWPALPIWLAPLSACVFTYLITRLSRFEVFGTETRNLRGTLWGFLGLLLLWLASLTWVRRASEESSVISDLLLAACCTFACWRAYHLLAPLRHEVTPQRLGRAIGGGILLMPALDAGYLAAIGAPGMATLVFGLAAPAYLLKRWYYLT